MSPQKVSRAAGLVTILAAIVILAAVFAGSTAVVIAGAVVAGIAGTVAALVADAPSQPAPASATEKRAVRARAEGSATVLLATVRNVANGSGRLGGDLQRVLAGIVADERGTIDTAEPHALAASFSRSDHPLAAVHAARRMLSNVDALSRRLGHDLRIAIGVHTGPKGDDTMHRAAAVRDAATESVPVLVSESAARQLGTELERVDTIAGQGWQLDVFTFPPAQKRLPGF